VGFAEAAHVGGHELGAVNVGPVHMPALLLAVAMRIAGVVVG